MKIFKQFLKQIKKELKVSYTIDKPKKKRINHNKNKIQIQNMGYFRNGKYISYMRIKFNNPYIENITF